MKYHQWLLKELSHFENVKKEILRCLEAIHTQMSSVTLPFLVRPISFKMSGFFSGHPFLGGQKNYLSTVCTWLPKDNQPSPFWPLACYHLLSKTSNFNIFILYCPFPCNPCSNVLHIFFVLCHRQLLYLYFYAANLFYYQKEMK